MKNLLKLKNIKLQFQIHNNNNKLSIPYAYHTSNTMEHSPQIHIVFSL